MVDHGRSLLRWAFKKRRTEHQIDAGRSQDGFVHLSDSSAAPNVARMFFANVEVSPA